jgi:hypothetical protein
MAITMPTSAPQDNKNEMLVILSLFMWKNLW